MSKLNTDWRDLSIRKDKWQANRLNVSVNGIKFHHS
jgi:hypothetical protein